MVPLRTEPDVSLFQQHSRMLIILKVQRQVTSVQITACHCDGFLEQSFDKLYIFCCKLENVNFCGFFLCVRVSVRVRVCVSVSEKPEVTI